MKTAILMLEVWSWTTLCTYWGWYARDKNRHDLMPPHLPLHVDHGLLLLLSVLTMATFGVIAYMATHL